MLGKSLLCHAQVSLIQQSEASAISKAKEEGSLEQGTAQPADTETGVSRGETERGDSSYQGCVRSVSRELTSVTRPRTRRPPSRLCPLRMLAVRAGPNRPNQGPRGGTCVPMLHR